MANKVKAAIVTGQHAFDFINFHDMFHSMSGIQPYVQHMEDFAGPGGGPQPYDAVVFYNFHQATPEKPVNWWEGNIVGAVEQLGEKPQGIVILHHSILAFPQWDLWRQIVGIHDCKFGFFPNQTVRSEIAKPDHPIVKGLKPWELVDETYTMADAGEDSDILITYNHEKSMKTIAWTRKHKQARVFCYEAGHDNKVYADPNFRTVLERGILWAAGRL